MESVLPAIITGVLSLVGVIISNIASSKSLEAKLQINQAVTDTKLTELTREVREHNGFAQKIPVLEERLRQLEDRCRELENKA